MRMAWWCIIAGAVGAPAGLGILIWLYIGAANK
jgi:hypothetical protein